MIEDGGAGSSCTIFFASAKPEPSKGFFPVSNW